MNIFFSFSEEAYIFTNFLKFLSSIKIRCGGFPENCSTEAEKLAYCNHVNKEMEFYSNYGLNITPDNVEANATKKNCAKEALNST